MGGVILPSPEQVEEVKRFLAESSGFHVDGVEFGKPASGLSMRVWLRDLKGENRLKTILAPDTEDFTDVAVVMSEWLDELSGAAEERMARARQRRALADG